MKNKIVSVSFFLFIFSFLILNIFIIDKDISYSERRKLQQFPNSINRFPEKFDKYTLDQFPFRDTFRSIKATANYKLLLALDNNGIYLKDDYIFKTEYPTNIKSIDNFTNIVNGIINNLNNNKIYYAIIPDKNYYLDDKLFLNINYDLLYNTVNKKLDINYIELRDILSLNDYYETDTHWRQEKILKVAQRLSENMHFDFKDDFIKNYYDKFYGVYYGQSAINRNPEKLVYLTNEAINNCMVKYFESNQVSKVYNIDNLESIDAYSVFLNGASSFIEIENPNNKSGRELVIFRDSYTSSLAPLLISSYSKITLIDIRYINSDNYLKLIDFKNQDILFLYSTLLVNNSSSLKK